MFHVLRKVGFPVDLLRFVSGRSFHISSLSNVQVQVSSTFSKFMGRRSAFWKDLHYQLVSLMGRNLKRIFHMKKGKR